MECANTLTYVSESFIKPNLENVGDINKPYILNPWNLRSLSSHYAQKGLIFTKPQMQTFSFEELVENLKQSLELTLIHFYPLVGQLTTQIDHGQRKCVVSVDYNKGPGAQFLYATLDMTLSDILSPTYTPRVLYSLFGHKEETIVNFDGRFKPLLSVQVTELLDGIFIGCSMNHAIADGVSFDHFFKIWPEIHSAKIRPPSAISHPPVINVHSIEHAFSYTSHPYEFLTRYKPPLEMKTRIFHFSTESVRWIKNKTNNEINNNNITISSFQALTALIWRALVRARGLSPNEKTSCSLPVNMRKRLDPPLPQECFGNIIDAIVVTNKVDELLRHNLGWGASLLHKYILNYDSKSANGFISRWKKAPSFGNMYKMEALRWVKIGGSPTFNRYSEKFGDLGTPIATRSGFGNKFPGKVIISRAYEGVLSVDVEISLMPESMANLESDQEFMDVVSLPNSQLSRSKI